MLIAAEREELALPRSTISLFTLEKEKTEFMGKLKVEEQILWWVGKEIL